jgi:hypothetical protein
MRIQKASDNFTAFSVISGFRCCVNEIQAFLEFYAASNEFLTDWLSRKAGENYHSTLGKIPKECRSHSQQYFHSILTIYILVVSTCLTL